MSKIWGSLSPLPTNLGPKDHLFGRLRNLPANLTAYRPIFGPKHDIDSRASALTTYIVSKCHELWSANGFVLDLHFYPHSVNSALCFIRIARLRSQRSANGTQPNFAKRRMVYIALTICCRRVGVVNPGKLGANKLSHFFGFSTTSTLNGEYLLNET